MLTYIRPSLSAAKGYLIDTMVGRSSHLLGFSCVYS